MTPEAYGALEARFRRLSLLGEASRLLEWDCAALMPRRGAAARAEQLTELTLIRHELLRDPTLADLLDSAENEVRIPINHRNNINLKFIASKLIVWNTNRTSSRSATNATGLLGPYRL